MTTLKKKSEATALVASLREAYNSGLTAKRQWRINQLNALRQMVVDNEQVIEAALFSDLGKSSSEAQLTEIGIILGDIDYALTHLSSWLKPQRVSVPLAAIPAKAYVVAEPVGVALIIAPWNYPMQLLLAPLIGAIAAGNAALVKPSELAPATSAVLAKLIPVYLDPRAIAVVEGAAKETGWLLEQHYDHIFYTGNGRVGRIVMAAAAKNLTPVSLELGGKSPIYIDDSVDLEAAALRIAWAKYLNAGQTCVAPDYILATAAVQKKLESFLVTAISNLYGADPLASADYGRIINDTHFTRLNGYLADGRVVATGTPVATKRFIPPTVLWDVARDAPVMQEEIFGPILPIITVTDMDDAINFINAKSKPLALYVFSNDAGARKAFTERTSSGALGFNVAILHLSVPGLPFGGVGESGMGAYRGKRSFDTFSHEKAVLSKPLKPETLALVYPPFTESKKKLIRGLLRKLS
jgi:aldehyde dehydrogenase (NAD+)